MAPSEAEESEIKEVNTVANFMQIITWLDLDSNQTSQPSLSIPAPEPTLSLLLSHSEIGGGPSVPTKAQWPMGGRKRGFYSEPRKVGKSQVIFHLPTFLLLQVARSLQLFINQGHFNPTRS